MLSMATSQESLTDEENNEIGNTHTSRVLSLLNEHRLQNTKLCDVQLSVNDEVLPVHRSVLAACSAYFLAMFNGDMKESKEQTVVLKDVDLDMLKLLIDYAYTGKLAINTDNAESLLELATLLQFPSVRKICCKFLKDQLDPLNCIGIRRFAASHHCRSFLDVVDDYMRENFVDVVNSEEFNTLPFEVLDSLISSDTLNVDCEERVYVAILKWIQADAPERSKYFCDLFSKTRLEYLSMNFVLKYLNHEEYIRTCFRCRDSLDDIKNSFIEKHINQSNSFKRHHLPRHSMAGFLVAVGGKEAGESITNKCEMYSLYNEGWTTISSLNRQRQQLGVCELDGRVFAIGGSDGINRLSSVEIYTPETNTWQNGVPLRTCRSGVGVGVLRDVIYALGGYDGRHCLSSVERFDKGSESWDDDIAPISTTRSFPGVVPLNGRLFVIGGNDGVTFLSSCECYDPISGKWMTIPSMALPRAGVGCAVLGDKLYVAGGFDGNKRLDEVEIYEPRMNTWSPVPSMNSFRDGVCMASYGGYLYAIGGIDGPSYLNTVEYFNPDTNCWYDTTPMQISRAASGIAVVTTNVIVEI